MGKPEAGLLIVTAKGIGYDMESILEVEVNRYPGRFVLLSGA